MGIPHVVVELGSLLGSAICGILFLISFTCFIQMIRMPQKIWSQHMRLHQAVRSMNKGTASEEDRRIIDDAQKVGMVGTGFSVSTGAEGQYMQLHYYVTKSANSYLFSREYPTTESLDAELEEFRIR